MNNFAYFPLFPFWNLLKFSVTSQVTENHIQSIVYKEV